MLVLLGEKQKAEKNCPENSPVNVQYNKHIFYKNFTTLKITLSRFALMKNSI